MKKTAVRIANFRPGESRFTSIKRAEWFVSKKKGIFLEDGSLKLFHHKLKRRRYINPDESQFNTLPIHKIGHSGDRVGWRKPIRARSQGPTAEEIAWRESVLLRDGYKCVQCGSDQKLEADHIKPQAVYPELKYEISNGRTLCHACHVKTPTYGSKARLIVRIEDNPG